MMPPTPDFFDRCRENLESSAVSDDTVALILVGKGTLVSQVRRSTRPEDLVHAARSLLELAADWLNEDDAPLGYIPLGQQVQEALDILPDLLDEEDDDGE